MSVFTQAFYDRLKGDATLTGLLGTYASSPSIFTKVPLPADFDIDAHGPYVVTSGQASDVPGVTDTKNKSGREIVRDVRCYSSTKLSPSTVDSIADRVRTLFHRQSFPVTGWSVEVSDVTGPIEADEDDALGRIVSVRLVLTSTV